MSLPTYETDMQIEGEVCHTVNKAQICYLTTLLSISIYLSRTKDLAVYPAVGSVPSDRIYYRSRILKDLVQYTPNLVRISRILYNLRRKKCTTCNGYWLLYPSPNLENKVIFRIYTK
jgi:hypothetical protein